VEGPRLDLDLIEERRRAGKMNPAVETRARTLARSAWALEQHGRRAGLVEMPNEQREPEFLGCDRLDGGCMGAGLIVFVEEAQDGEYVNSHRGDSERGA